MTSGRLFDPDSVAADEGPTSTTPDRRRRDPAKRHGHEAEPLAVRVRPDVSGIAKEFDYLVPPALVDRVSVGSIVRIELNRRSVAAWVTVLGTDPVEGIDLRPITKVSSVGPSADVVDLARWAAWRWSGNLATVLRTASPPRMVHSLAPSATRTGPRSLPEEGPATAETSGPTIYRSAPSEDVVPLLESLIASDGDTLVITPRLGQAGALAGRLRRAGYTTRLHPRDWAATAGRGGVVFGARSAVWARIPDLRSIVVIDEHDEALQEERNPTWHARDVAIERAARAGIACHLVSPVPSPAALEAAGPPMTPPRARERGGWPVVEVVDRRHEEPGRTGLFSPRVAELVRGPGSVLAVLNRKGRAMMLACALCGELARTEDGERLMTERDGRLVAPATGEERPVVCAACGATKLKRLRLGVTRAAEELSALAGEPVDELTASGRDTADGGPGQASPSDRPSRVVVGTEAALHQIGRSDTVVFLDFDQELLAPRYRAAEQALALLVLAARTVGGRAGGGRIVVQTRTPDHRVLRAAVRADPGRFSEEERALRRSMGWPPYGALAEISGQAAAGFAEPLRTVESVTVLGPRDDGRYLLKTGDPDTLADVLAAADRPGGRFRVAVDPPRA